MLEHNQHMDKIKHEYDSKLMIIHENHEEGKAGMIKYALEIITYFTFQLPLIIPFE